MTNREIVEKCISDPVLDLSKYDRVEAFLVSLPKRDKEGHVIGERKIPCWRLMEALGMVIDQDTSAIVPFKLRWPQRVVYAVLCEQYINNLPMRVDILKARQMGLSTFISFLFMLLTVFRAYAKAVITADLEDHTKNLFKIYKTFFDHLNDRLPNAKKIKHDELAGIFNADNLKPTLAHAKYGEMMETEYGSSTIECVTAGESSGRSGHYKYAHLSEAGYMKSLEDLCTSIFQTVSINDTESIIIIETTANGYNEYKDRWDRDASGSTAFAALFIPWFKNPDYRKKAPDKLPEFPLWFYDKLREHPEVTNDQLYWYWIKYSESQNKSKTLQEYPWDPEDAFVSSGLNAFDAEILKSALNKSYRYNPEHVRFAYTKDYSLDGEHIKVSDVHPVEMLGEKTFRIYTKPVKGRHYVVICDPTKGDNNDYSAIHVMDQNTGVQQACFNAKDDIDKVAFQLYCVGLYYNTALISSENNTGPTIMNMLVKMGYPKLYVEQSEVGENVNQTVSLKLGHCTTRGNRDGMIADLQIAIRDNPDLIKDTETLKQMQTFQYVKSATGTIKAQAASQKYHDDLVMAYVPFWKVRIQQDFDRRTAENPKTIVHTDDPNDYLYAMERRKRREGKGRVRDVTGIVW